MKVAGKYVSMKDLKPGILSQTTAELRRVPNLFEIVTMDYWKKNFGYQFPEDIRKRKEDYLADKAGYEHVMHIIDMKLKLLGRDPAAVSEQEKIEMSDAFFAGGHELIVGKNHYVKDAEFDTQLCNSGELTPEEHYQYIKFTIKGMKDIYDNNKHVRYVSVFQNWLKPAGASLTTFTNSLWPLTNGAFQLRGKSTLSERTPTYTTKWGQTWPYISTLWWPRTIMPLLFPT